MVIIAIIILIINYPYHFSYKKDYQRDRCNYHRDRHLRGDDCKLAIAMQNMEIRAEAHALALAR